jgi:transcriptional regulator with XRE-family HTH domain
LTFLNFADKLLEHTRGGKIMKNRIREALSIRNMKQIELVEKTGLDKGAVSNYVNNKYQPKQNALFQLAKVLDVNEIWLAGYDVPMERNVVDKNSSETAALLDKILRDREFYQLVVNLARLNDNQLTIITKMVNELAK